MLAAIGRAMGSSGFVGGLLRGAAGSALSQGVASVTGLKKDFDLVGVAVAGISGGVGAEVLGHIHGADTMIERSGAGLASGVAGGIAGAAMGSALTGKSFGDTLMGTLPDIIGQMVGNLLVGAASGQGDEQDERVAGLEAAGGALGSDASVDPRTALSLSGAVDLAAGLDPRVLGGDLTALAGHAAGDGISFSEAGPWADGDGAGISPDLARQLERGSARLLQGGPGAAPAGQDGDVSSGAGKTIRAGSVEFVPGGKDAKPWADAISMLKDRKDSRKIFDALISQEGGAEKFAHLVFDNTMANDLAVAPVITDLMGIGGSATDSSHYIEEISEKWTADHPDYGPLSEYGDGFANFLDYNFGKGTSFDRYLASPVGGFLSSAGGYLNQGLLLIDGPGTPIDTFNQSLYAGFDLIDQTPLGDPGVIATMESTPYTAPIGAFGTGLREMLALRRATAMGNAAEGTVVTGNGIRNIEQHLAGLDALDEFPPNLAMIDRLKSGFTESHDLAFYEHETIESDLMRGGMEARDAHLETLNRQGIPYKPGYESQLYHPSVISRYLDHFNPAAHP